MLKASKHEPPPNHRGKGLNPTGCVYFLHTSSCSGDGSLDCPLLTPTHKRVQDDLGGQGPVVHAQTVHQRQEFECALQQVTGEEEVVLEEPLAAPEGQRTVLLQGEIAPPGMGEEGVVLQRGEDGFLEMQETGEWQFGGKGWTLTTPLLIHIFSRLLATWHTQSNPETLGRR